MNDEARIETALRHWVDVKRQQEEKSKAGGKAQQGRRSSVTGGAHLDGLNKLVVEQIERAGMTGLTFRANKKATVPGYYRPSKAWDLAVLKDDLPLLVVEYKSMYGSEGNNLNNRFDEVFGVAEDVRQAMEHGLLPQSLLRAYVFVMGMTPKSTASVKIGKVIGKADPEFTDASYLDRAAIMCRRLHETGLYHMTWAVAVQMDPFGWHEPDPRVGWEQFAAAIQQAFSARDGG
ncbi:MAG: PaeR7I family type II restriction endonuclease [Actinocrinis sp.]